MNSEQNRKLYSVPGGSEYKLREKNAVFINYRNTLKHEMAKALGAYMIRKWGDVKFPPSVLQLLDDLDTLMNIEFQLFDEHHVDFITEAVPRDELNRRVDLVRLSDNQYYEFENDKKRAKKGSVTVVL